MVGTNLTDPIMPRNRSRYDVRIHARLLARSRKIVISDLCYE